MPVESIWNSKSAFARAGFAARIEALATEWATVAGMVAAGVGITVAPESVTTMRREGTAYLPLRDSEVRVRLLAVSRDEENALVTEFMNAITEAVQRGGP